MARMAVRLPHELLPVPLTPEESAVIQARLDLVWQASIRELGATVAGSLRARQLGGYVNQVMVVWGDLGAGMQVLSADQVRLLMNLMGTGFRTDAELAVYARLRAIWNGEEGG